MARQDARSGGQARRSDRAISRSAAPRAKTQNSARAPQQTGENLGLEGRVCCEEFFSTKQPGVTRSCIPEEVHLHTDTRARPCRAAPPPPNRRRTAGSAAENLRTGIFPSLPAPSLVLSIFPR